MKLINCDYLLNTEHNELFVSLMANYVEHLLRALADTGDNNGRILEAYNSAPFIKTDQTNTAN
jgi:hypothetical protein